MPQEFLNRLYELPDNVKTAWVGTRFPTSKTDSHKITVSIQEGTHEARVAVNMVERTVKAYPAFKVVEYFFGKGDIGSAPTWRGWEDWNHVYIRKKGGKVKCTALCMLMPNQWVTVQKFHQRF
jgi:hypothetical protein